MKETACEPVTIEVFDSPTKFNGEKKNHFVKSFFRPFFGLINRLILSANFCAAFNSFKFVNTANQRRTELASVSISNM